MAIAAIRPAATARTARSEPSTASPPARSRQVGRESSGIDRDAPAVDLQPLALGASPVDLLSHRRDHGLALDLELRLRDRDGAPPAVSVGLAQIHALANQRPAVAAVVDGRETDRRRQELERHTLRLRALDLVHQARHLTPRAPVEHAHLGAEAARAAGAVHRGVAAADHDHLPPELRPLTLGHRVQELRPRERQVLALAAQARRGLCPDAEEDRVVVAAEVGEREVAPPALFMRNEAPSCSTTRISASSAARGRRYSGIP